MVAQGPHASCVVVAEALTVAREVALTAQAKAVSPPAYMSTACNKLYSTHLASGSTRSLGFCPITAVTQLAPLRPSMEQPLISLYPRQTTANSVVAMVFLRAGRLPSCKGAPIRLFSR